MKLIQSQVYLVKLNQKLLESINHISSILYVLPAFWYIHNFVIRLYGDKRANIAVNYLESFNKKTFIFYH